MTLLLVLEQGTPRRRPWSRPRRNAPGSCVEPLSWTTWRSRIPAPVRPGQPPKPPNSWYCTTADTPTSPQPPHRLEAVQPARDHRLYVRRPDSKHLCDRSSGCRRPDTAAPRPAAGLHCRHRGATASLAYPAVRPPAALAAAPSERTTPTRGRPHPAWPGRHQATAAPQPRSVASSPANQPWSVAPQLSGCAAVVSRWVCVRGACGPVRTSRRCAPLVTGRRSTTCHRYLPTGARGSRSRVGSRRPRRCAGCRRRGCRRGPSAPGPGAAGSRS